MDISVGVMIRTLLLFYFFYNIKNDSPCSVIGYCIKHYALPLLSFKNKQFSLLRDVQLYIFVICKCSHLLALEQFSMQCICPDIITMCKIHNIKNVTTLVKY